MSKAGTGATVPGDKSQGGRGEPLLRIGRLAKELGTTTKTLRFYEQIGLLAASARSGSGYRLYNRTAVTTARLVLGLRRLGLSIHELQELCGGTTGYPLRRRLLALLDEKIREMDLNLGLMQGRRDDLAARHQALLTTPRSRLPDCVCDALFISCHCKEKPGKPR